MQGREALEEENDFLSRKSFPLGWERENNAAGEYKKIGEAAQGQGR